VREALQALLTLEGLFARMKPFVFSQVMFVLEGLGADIAFVWTLTCNQEHGKDNC